MNVEKIARDMPTGFLWEENCGHETGILMQEAVEFAMKIRNQTLEDAAIICNKNRANSCADEIRKLKS